MRIFLLKDVENTGYQGEIKEVSDGFATNYLIPRGLAVAVTDRNEKSFKKVIQHREKEVATSAVKTSALAERIKSTVLTISRKSHDGGKLYGAVSSGEISEELLRSGITVEKNKIALQKSIKALGTYEITVRLSNSLLPKFTLRVVEDK